MVLGDSETRVFPWPHHERTLYDEFARIQIAAKDDNGERIITLPCRQKHEHTDACSLYGFHDLRRAFATQNAFRLAPDALQALMRHKSYLTTKRYINRARQLDGAVEQLHVPESLKGTRADGAGDEKRQPFFRLPFFVSGRCSAGATWSVGGVLPYPQVS